MEFKPIASFSIELQSFLQELGEEFLKSGIISKQDFDDQSLGIQDCFQEYASLSGKPYTYFIGWSKKNLWYYGSKYAKEGVDWKKFWVSYKTSSGRVAKAIEEHGEPDIIQIRKIFDDRSACLKWEHKVLRRMKVHINDNWLNKTDNSRVWQHACKDLKWKTYTNGTEIIYTYKEPPEGFYEKERTKTYIRPSHSEKLSGRVRVNNGKISKLLSRSEAERLVLNEDWEYGNLQSHKDKISASHSSYTCPHCNKTGGRIMLRWHFDRCKYAYKDLPKSSSQKNLERHNRPIVKEIKSKYKSLGLVPPNFLGMFSEDKISKLNEELDEISRLRNR